MSQQIVDAIKKGSLSQAAAALLLSPNFDADELELVYAAQRVAGSKTTPDALSLGLTIPEGLYCLGYLLEYSVNPTGAVGTGTDAISSFVTQITCKSEKRKNELYLNGQSITDHVAAESIIARRQNLSFGDGYVDPVIAANATAYFGAVLIKHIPKGKQLKFVVNTRAITGLAGFSTPPTGGTYDVYITAICTRVPPGMSEILYGNVYASLSTVDLPDVDYMHNDNMESGIDSIYIANNNNELSGYISGLTIGGADLNAAQINANEDLTNVKLAKSGTPNAVAATVGQQYWGTLPFPSQAANKLFAFFQRLAKLGRVVITTSTARDTYVVARTYTAP